LGLGLETSRDLGLGLETSRDRISKVLVLNTKVLVLKLALGLGIVFWQLNNDFVLRWILRSSSLHVIISTQSSHQMLLLPKLQKVLAVSPSCFCYFRYLDGLLYRPVHYFMSNVHAFSSCKAMLSCCRLRHLRGLIQGVGTADECKKTLLANSLV